MPNTGKIGKNVPNDSLQTVDFWPKQPKIIEIDDFWLFWSKMDIFMQKLTFLGQNGQKMAIFDLFRTSPGGTIPDPDRV